MAEQELVRPSQSQLHRVPASGFIGRANPAPGPVQSKHELFLEVIPFRGQPQEYGRRFQNTCHQSPSAVRGSGSDGTPTGNATPTETR